MLEVGKAHSLLLLYGGSWGSAGCGQGAVSWLGFCCWVLNPFPSLPLLTVLQDLSALLQGYFSTLYFPDRCSAHMHCLEDIGHCKGKGTCCPPPPSLSRAARGYMLCLDSCSPALLLLFFSLPLLLFCSPSSPLTSCLSSLTHQTFLDPHLWSAPNGLLRVAVHIAPFTALLWPCGWILCSSASAPAGCDTGVWELPVLPHKLSKPQHMALHYQGSALCWGAGAPCRQGQCVFASLHPRRMLHAPPLRDLGIIRLLTGWDGSWASSRCQGHLCAM